jgi:hypothetical protein
MLFLVMQITIASPHHGQNVGLSNPWSEYCKMLPRYIPLPTLWTEEERVMLVGTSLEVCAVIVVSRASFLFKSRCMILNHSCGDGQPPCGHGTGNFRVFESLSMR